MPSYLGPLAGATGLARPALIEYSARIMVTAPQPKAPRSARRRALRSMRYLRTQLTRQFITRNRRLAFALSLVTIAIAVASVHLSEWWFSPGVMILPILAGGLLLWPRALRIFFGFAAAALIYDVIEDKAVISPSDAVSHTGFAVDWLRTSLAQTRRVSRFALHARRLAVRSLRLFQGGVIRHEKSGRHVTA